MQDVMSSGGYIFRIERKEYKGKQYLDIRKHYQTRENPGKWFATTKGVFIPVEDVVNVIDAVKKEGFC